MYLPAGVIVEVFMRYLYREVVNETGKCKSNDIPPGERTYIRRSLDAQNVLLNVLCTFNLHAVSSCVVVSSCGCVSEIFKIVPSTSFF